MKGYRFTQYIATGQKQKTFDSLLNIFLQLVSMTGGNVSEALSWMSNLDRRHGLTSDTYGMADFIQDLKDKGYITEEKASGTQTGFTVTPKTDQSIRKQALEEIFGKLKKSGKGSHNVHRSGAGDEPTADRREFQFGDKPEQVAMSESIKNAQINHGLGDFTLTENDLEVQEYEYKAQTSTVLMLDISHSMILYGEDRITPAKKTAMALAETIKIKYPKDTLDIIVFGNDAWQIQLKDLPYLEVGPYHTNTVAGLELAMELLKRRKNKNKQILMITDGKPTCLKEGLRYYKNSFGLDRKIVAKTLNLADQCRKSKITITTFMIASDPYLQEFVREFTQANHGKAYYSDLNKLGSFVFEDFQKNRRKRV